MKKLFKRIIPCLIVLLSIFTIASCKEDVYKYPSQVPLYTSDGIFAEIGNLKISNKDIYNRLVQSYGLEEIENAIDAELLKDVTLNEKQEKDFQDQMTNLIYGTLDVEGGSNNSVKITYAQLNSEVALVDEVGGDAEDVGSGLDGLGCLFVIYLSRLSFYWHLGRRRSSRYKLMRSSGADRHGLASSFVIDLPGHPS